MLCTSTGNTIRNKYNIKEVPLFRKMYSLPSFLLFFPCFCSFFFNFSQSIPFILFSFFSSIFIAFLHSLICLPLVFIVFFLSVLPSIFCFFPSFLPFNFYFFSSFIFLSFLPFSLFISFFLSSFFLSLFSGPSKVPLRVIADVNSAL